jgi:ribosomal protein S18 acetylase RimI-like enzyme
MGWLRAAKTLCLFEVDLKEVAAPACDARVAVEYRRLDAAAWAAQRHTHHIPDRHLFHTRFARGEQCWIAQQADNILAYCWATQAPVDIGEIRCVMHPRGDEVYLYDALTFAAYRGQNLYPALLQRMVAASRAQGWRRALIFVLSDNTASIRGVQKAGFREFQRVTYRTILGFPRYAYQPPLTSAAGVDLRPA